MTSAMIGNLNARLGLDTAEFTAGLAGARQSLAGFGSTLKAFAATAALSTLGAFGVAALRQAAQVGDLAEAIGVTAEQIQVYNRMAIASGTSAEVMAKGLQEIATQSTDANSALSKLFKANGVNAKGMSVNDQIRTFMDLLKNARSQSEQLAIAYQVLGARGGRELVESLREGAKGYDQAQKDMMASGELMSNAEIKRLQDLETEYNKVTDRIGQYWMKMVAGLAGGLTEYSTRVESITAIRTAREKILQSGTGFGQLGGGTAAGKTSRLDRVAYDPLTSVRVVPVKVTELPKDPEKPGKTKQDPLWKGTSKGVSENPMQEGPITGYDIRGTGLEVDQLTDSFADARNASEDLANSIADGLGQAVQGLVDGSLKFKDAFGVTAQSVMSDLADITMQLLRSGLLKMLFGMGTKVGGAQGLFGSFGGFYAEGGTLGAGKWGIAGENGLEVVEGPASIRPLSAGGGGTVVNVHNYGGGDVQQRKRRGPDGREYVDVIVGITRKEQAKGAKRLLGAGFGLPPQLNQR